MHAKQPSPSPAWRATTASTNSPCPATANKWYVFLPHCSFLPPPDSSIQAHATFRGSTEFGLSTDIDTATAGYDADIKATESCTLEPSSQAVCSVLLSASVEDNGKTKTKTTITYSGAEATGKWFEVPITGGAEKLPPATATCDGNYNAAPATTGLTDLYKVVIVPGAGAL